MLHNIKPNRKKKRGEGSLTQEELPLVKGLLKEGYLAQDIVHIVNQGRPTTINSGRINKVKKSNDIQPSSQKQIQEYITIQSSYNPKTLLNPYKERDHRLIRAREAMICAVQTFNNPSVIFKTETFCVLANIAWTYLIHEKMERDKAGSTKLKNGNSITLNGTLDREICPIKNDAVIANLKTIIEIRNKVEHEVFCETEKILGSVFQACCINFNNHMTDWFDEHLTLSNELSLALQFVKMQKDQFVELENSNLPEGIRTIYRNIQLHEFQNDPAFQVTVYYTNTVSSKTSADIIQLVSHDENITTDKIIIKKVTEQPMREKEIVATIKKQGFSRFTARDHQNFWKTKWFDANLRNKDKSGKFGAVYLNSWGWHKEWIEEVIKYCQTQDFK